MPHPLFGRSVHRAPAGEQKTFWEIAEAGHISGLAAHPAEYEQRVVAIVTRACEKANIISK